MLLSVPSPRLPLYAIRPLYRLCVHSDRKEGRPALPGRHASVTVLRSARRTKAHRTRIGTCATCAKAEGEAGMGLVYSGLSLFRSNLNLKFLQPCCAVEFIFRKKVSN